MNTPSKKHGGARAGAGRKALFKESTRPMRIPLSRIESVRAFLMATTFPEPPIEPLPLQQSASPLDRLDTLKPHLEEVPSSSDYVRAFYQSTSFVLFWLDVYLRMATYFLPVTFVGVNWLLSEVIQQTT